MEIDKSYVKALLKELIACDTTDYNEENGQSIVERELASIGCIIQRIRPDPYKLSEKYSEFNMGHTYENRDCILAEFPGSGYGRSLILNAHIDTVFPAKPDAWHSDPFCPYEKDKKIYGLGSCDTKGGLAAMIAALKLLHERKECLKGTVYFHCVVDEEAGGGNGTLACLDAGMWADAVLVAEPTGLQPASAHMGSYALKIIIEGQSVHGNLKRAGVNPIEKALPILESCYALGQTWEKRSYGVLPPPVLSAVAMNTGEEAITVPGSCAIVLNYTYLPDGYDYENELLTLLENCQRQDSWFLEHPLRIEKLHDVKPYHMHTDSIWGTTVQRCVEKELGKQTNLFGLGCGADARFYANTGGMDTIILGPGNILNAHSPNEYVEIDQLYNAVRIYYAILCDWCGLM